jgi:hypothetical protein
MPTPPPPRLYWCVDANGVGHESSSPCASGYTTGGIQNNQLQTAPPQNQAGNGLYAGAANPLSNAGLSGFLSWIDNAANWKHTGLLLAGAALVIVGLVGLAGDKYVSSPGPKILPV